MSIIKNRKRVRLELSPRYIPARHRAINEWLNWERGRLA
jgi:hypothetical protein